MRDSRGRSPSPRRLGFAVSRVREEITPETPLATIQTVWAEVVGPQLAAVTSPVEEREGVLTVACEGAVWTQELSLMEPRLREKLDLALGGNGPEKLRFRTDR